MALPSLNINHVIPIYQHYLSELIDKLGKPVDLVFIDKAEKDPNLADWKQERDSVRKVRITALLEYAPKDYRPMNGVVEKPQNILQIKTYLTHAKDLDTADYIIPSVDSQDEVSATYRRLRPTIPTGLKEEMFCVSFWEQR